MREVLRRLFRERDGLVTGDAHLGLVFERYGRIATHPQDDECGTIPVGDRRGFEPRRAFLGDVATGQTPADYPAAFARWQQALVASGATVCEVQATRRLLVGHGNSSPVEVGLTLHHTWGVPFLPGTALKGLLNHLADRHGRSAPDDDWRGVAYDGGRPAGSPGAYHRTLFGEPSLRRPDGSETLGQRGAAVFEDALMVPPAERSRRLLCVDVMTPHQSQYYKEAGGAGPIDWDAPNPISFLAVRPGTRFLVAISGPREAAELALRHLLDALQREGIGSKTAAGYGRMRRDGEIRVATDADDRVRPTSGGRAGAARRASASTASAALLALKGAVDSVLKAKDQVTPIAARFAAAFATMDLIDVLPAQEREAGVRELEELTRHAGLMKRCRAQVLALVEHCRKGKGS